MSKRKLIGKEKEIIKIYLSGISSNKLAKMHHVDKVTIVKMLKRNNVTIRPHRKYNCDETYFEKINTPEKAYFLGFMYTDGNNSKKYFKLALQAKDLHILESFRESLRSDAKIYFFKRSQYNKNHQDEYCLRINNEKMCNDLTKVGVMPNKTFKIKFPMWLNKQLYPHFIRGLFDGDGCFQSHKINEYSTSSISILGTKDLCNVIKGILKKYLNVDCAVYKNGNIFCLRTGSKVVTIKIMDWLYKNSNENIRLKRKYDKYITARSTLFLRKFMTYDECRETISDLDITTMRNWYLYWKNNKKPLNIPMAVNSVYRDKGWVSWYHFLQGSPV